MSENTHMSLIWHSYNKSSIFQDYTRFSTSFSSISTSSRHQQTVWHHAWVIGTSASRYLEMRRQPSIGCNKNTSWPAKWTAQSVIRHAEWQQKRGPKSGDAHVTGARWWPVSYVTAFTVGAIYLWRIACQYPIGGQDKHPCLSAWEKQKYDLDF